MKKDIHPDYHEITDAVREVTDRLLYGESG